jgi:RNA polymerase sigma-70 factor (ECF subfamily)
MKSLCLRYLRENDEAEDVLQEGFILMFEKISTYKFEGSFEGWLRKIMTNQCLKYLIDKKKMTIEKIDDIKEVLDDASELDARLTNELLINGIKELPVGYRTVFNMYVIEGYSHKEIADTLKIEESSSRSQLAKSKAFLRKFFKETDFI